MILRAVTISTIRFENFLLRIAYGFMRGSRVVKTKRLIESVSFSTNDDIPGIFSMVLSMALQTALHQRSASAQREV